MRIPHKARPHARNGRFGAQLSARQCSTPIETPPVLRDEIHISYEPVSRTVLARIALAGADPMNALTFPVLATQICEPFGHLLHRCIHAAGRVLQ